MIQIIEVTNPKLLKEFIHLPWVINKNNPNWVPPLMDDEKKLFSSTKNPAFAHCSTKMVLAQRDGQTVGRALGIIHHPYNQLTNQNWARFGFMESIDSNEVFTALINHVTDWAKQHGCDKLIGPFGFSDKDPQGFLSFGYDGPTVIVTNCNMPYMVEFAKANEMTPFLDLVQYRVPIGDDLLRKLKTFSDRALKNTAFNVIEFNHTKHVKPYIHDVFELMNNTYTPIFGYSPITKDEADEFAERFLPMLNPHLIKVIANQSHQVIAFIVAMPDIAKGLRKSSGKLWPTGWFHILRSLKKSDRLVLLLGAVATEMRHKGVDAVLGYHLLKSAQKVKFKEMDSHLIMESNYKMRREIERLDGMELYKRYTIFQKDI